MAGTRRGNSGNRRHDGNRAPAVLLAVVVIGSLLAVGTVHVPTLWVVTVVAVAAAALAVRREILESGYVPLTAPALIFALLSAYTLLQAVPLPMSVLQRIAPHNADVWQRALLPLGEAGPSWAPISLDPGASFVEALKWFVYTCVFTASAITCSSRGAHWGVGLVFLSALLAVLTTLGHGLAGAQRVFGIYEPHVSLSPWHMGPLLNSNNLAGYLNLGAMCGLGLLLMHRPPAPRWAIGIGTATIIGVASTSASRSGFAVLPLGVLAFAATLARRRANSSQGSSNRTVFLLTGAAVVGGAAFAFLGATRQTWVELYDRNLMKLAMVWWTKPMIADYAIWGIGRGAFASVFPAYRTQPGHSVFTHPENFIVQWLVEWGIPVGVLALGSLIWLLRPSAIGVRRSAVASGAGIGVAVVLLQNLADLGTEIPGVCIAMTTALGALWGDGRRRGVSRTSNVWLLWLGRRTTAGAHTQPSDTTPRAIDPRLGGLGAGESHRASRRVRPEVVLPIGLASVAIVLMVLVGVRGWHTLEHDRQAAHEQFAKGAVRSSAGRADLRAFLRGAMSAHPAEPYFPLIGAVACWLGGDETPIPWIQRSLERSHVNGHAHLLLAELLASKGANAQALLELRLAIQDDPGSTRYAAQRAVHITRSFEQLLHAVPSGPAGADMLDKLAAAFGEPDRALRGRLFREALARDSSLLRPHAALAGDLLQDLERATAAARAERDSAAASPCSDEQRAACVAELETHLRAVAQLDPNTSWADQLRFRFLLLNNQVDEALTLLATRCPTVVDRLSCMQAQLAVAIRAKLPTGQLGLLVKDMAALSCSSDTACAGAMAWAGDTLASLGDLGGAMTYYERALRDVPNEAEWLKLAGVASRIGAHARAAEALERVARLRGGGDADLKARIDTERARALRFQR